MFILTLGSKYLLGIRGFENDNHRNIRTPERFIFQPSHLHRCLSVYVRLDIQWRGRQQWVFMFESDHYDQMVKKQTFLF